MIHNNGFFFSVNKLLPSPLEVHQLTATETCQECKNWWFVHSLLNTTAAKFRVAHSNHGALSSKKSPAASNWCPSCWEKYHASVDVMAVVGQAPNHQPCCGLLQAIRRWFKEGQNTFLGQLELELRSGRFRNVGENPGCLPIPSQLNQLSKGHYDLSSWWSWWSNCQVVHSLTDTNGPATTTFKSLHIVTTNNWNATVPR